MHRSLCLIAVVLTGACSDGLTPSPTDVSGPAFNFTNGPESPGPHVFRTAEGAVIYIFGSDDVAATVGLSTPLAEACSTGQGDVVLVNSQIVTAPSGRANSLDLGRNLPVVVYATPFTGDPCALAAAPIVATGTAHLSSTISFSPDGSGKLSQRAQGPVTYTAGGAGRLSAFLNMYFAPGGDIDRIVGDLTLTPAHP